MSDANRGELALVLHTHMPYVEGFGTWPFGEEWLWEAIATCYLPLLPVLDKAAEMGSPITLSVTPVLADQLAAPGVPERFLAFLRDVRAETHRLDIEGCRDTGHDDLAAEIELSSRDYEAARERFEAIGGDLVGALAPHAAWTSSATHAVLPLLATDAGVSLQLETGIESHRARFGGWGGGLWLPECAHAPWLDPLLAAAGVRATCLDLTDVLGMGSPEQLHPLAPDHGPTLVPLDRAIVDLVWHDGHGYPTHGAYRDHHHMTVHHHRPWANDRGPYDRAAAAAIASQHAQDFVGRVIERLDRVAAELGRPGLCVCTLDTELLGHWWFEGPLWLEGVIDQARRRGLRISGLDDSLTRHEPAPAPELPTTSWGTPRDLSTWDAPAVADMAFAARAAELLTFGAAARGGAPARALRELLALQSSDWAFLATRDTAGSYPRERASGHLEALGIALASLDSSPAPLRNLAPMLP